ncbi:putative flippase GtrA [Kitasatospora sp. SolWspMP-SS2h]|uniref:GtrA family protein n=1 Tax=Kitasatospora sp. SolWspMP-SS2h TaxID=1305729 RepID=UPI000DBA0483|nr:GtrA family protein [Kitasatospora sp. SolWspMP-SS2h]RAJ41388.1 putative flippase GtrA [Kitasatospora sp. SolWspMP-SS2h]
MPSPTQRVLAAVPERYRPFLVKHRTLVKFLVVGGTCFLLTMLINFGLKTTVLENKPVLALTVATVVTTVISYVLNRQWSFRAVGRKREAAGFFVVSALAVGVNDLPLVASRYVFDLRTPDVSHVAQEVADFFSGMIVGTLLAMAFRFWAMNRFVFTELAERAPDDGQRPGREPERV